MFLNKNELAFFKSQHQLQGPMLENISSAIYLYLQYARMFVLCSSYQPTKTKQLQIDSSKKSKKDLKTFSIQTF
jgi:hypothetical protein